MQQLKWHVTMIKLCGFRQQATKAGLLLHTQLTVGMLQSTQSCEIVASKLQFCRGSHLNVLLPGTLLAVSLQQTQCSSLLVLSQRPITTQST